METLGQKTGLMGLAGPPVAVFIFRKHVIFI